jgi:5-methylcytosine-specific restriction endonuclease McrA
MSEVLDVVEAPADRKRRIERERYSAHREARKAQVAAYKAANPEKVAALAKRRREENANSIDAYQKSYRASHREEFKRQAREWRQNNRARADAQIAAWYAAHPGAMRVKKQNRRARKMAAGGKLSRDLVPKLLELQRWKCAGCCGDLRKSGYHLDHRVALARGGLHVDENMQLLCPPCNCSKGAKDPVEWAQENGRLL